MSATDLIDALAADIAASATGLPAYTTTLYTRPLVVTPAACPMLAIFPKERDARIESTASTYERDDVITVAWFVNVASSLDTGTVDPATAKAAIQAGETIAALLETYGGGISGYPGQCDATVEKTRYGHTDGGIWVAETTIRITAWT